MAELDDDHAQVIRRVREAVLASERMLGSRAHAHALLRSSTALIDDAPRHETLERPFAATREDSGIEIRLAAVTCKALGMAIE